jgi:hypothetical protein
MLWARCAPMPAAATRRQTCCAVPCHAVRPLCLHPSFHCTSGTGGDQQPAGSAAWLHCLDAAHAAREQRAASRAARAAARSAAAAAWHAEAEAEARRRREEAQKQRLAALRTSNMSAYKEMLRATKNQRLTQVGPAWGRAGR